MTTAKTEAAYSSVQLDPLVRDDDWYGLNLARHEAAGMLDAEHGVFEWPHEDDDDPQNKDENEAYKRGFDRRRHELGEHFDWA